MFHFIKCTGHLFCAICIVIYISCMYSVVYNVFLRYGWMHSNMDDHLNDRSVAT